MRALLITLVVALGPLLLLSACAQEQKVAVVPAVYCYRTLAKADCYDFPQPDDRPGLVGYYGAPPAVPVRQPR